MESKIMHNFRKRAENRGYTKISVKYVRSDYDGHYFKVSAIEPLTGAEVSIENEMHYFNALFRSEKNDTKTEI